MPKIEESKDDIVLKGYCIIWNVFRFLFERFYEPIFHKVAYLVQFNIFYDCDFKC